MRPHNFLAIFLVSVLVVMLNGCAKKDVETPIAGDSSALAPPESLDTDISANVFMEGRTSGPMLPVYFDFDSSAINQAQAERIETNAAFLKQHPAVKIRIEGNCDPRGTNEYNLALGERRALRAKRYLQNLGVDSARMDTVSWGEEKLLLHGHDEISWAQNRRDDFVVY